MKTNLMFTRSLLLVLGAALPGAVGASAAAGAAKTFIDYFQPMPIRSALTKEAWGADPVLPRDRDNGLESRDRSTSSSRPDPTRRVPRQPRSRSSRVACCPI